MHHMLVRAVWSRESVALQMIVMTSPSDISISRSRSFSLALALFLQGRASNAGDGDRIVAIRVGWGNSRL